MKWSYCSWKSKPSSVSRSSYKLMIKSTYDVSVKTTNKANVFLVLLSFTWLFSQLGECVDNDTEDNIQANNTDNHVKAHIKEESNPPILQVPILECYRRQIVTHTTSIAKTIVDWTQKTMHEWHTNWISWFVE